MGMLEFANIDATTNDNGENNKPEFQASLIIDLFEKTKIIELVIGKKSDTKNTFSLDEVRIYK